ncbi:FMRFamide receptor-like [Pomacea canaliculata]|uniref:FMRFamide receptor-like n=1 Tax=Pomacea canaliculata TaxID=400727 RepID=UPI000D72691B|nr:FMRFamide receptor-like [Pomacea canaliculata]
MEGTYTSTDVYSHNHTRKDYLYANAESYYIHRVGCIPVALLGIVGNLVSLVVWNSQTTYSATIFLFKYLAVWDTAFLVSVIPVIFLSRSRLSHNALFAVTFLSTLARLESVHTTLLIAITRWLAVYRPVHVHTGSLLTRRHVVLACLVVSVWCLAMLSVVLAAKLASEFAKSWLRVLIFVEIVNVAVSVLPLIVFNILTTKKICSHFSWTPTSSSGPQPATSRTSNQRLTMASVWMSVFTVAAYTLGLTVTYISVFLLLKKNRKLFIIFSSVSDLLEVFNSSVNIIFYLTLSRTFRSSFKKHFIGRGRAVGAG